MHQKQKIIYYHKRSKDHLTNVLCILHVGKNVRVKLEKKIIISCNFCNLLFYTLISSNTTLRYISAQGILESHLELTSNAWVTDIRANGPSG